MQKHSRHDARSTVMAIRAAVLDAMPRPSRP